MPHKFNPQHYWKLDNPERRKILPPEQTLVRLGLKENDLFVDIGCGTGYFTLPALDIVGPGGKVYGLDTSEDMLNKLKEKAGTKGLERPMLINTEEYDLHLEENSSTFVLMSNVLHEIDDKVRIINAVKDLLIQNGRVAIIEWEKKESSEGPPLEHRLEKEYVKSLLLNQGFIILDSLDFGELFYAITAKKYSD